MQQHIDLHANCVQHHVLRNLLQPDTCLQEYKQRLVKAKKYIQNLKQQAADATAARDQAVADLQAAQQQIYEKSRADVGSQQDLSGDATGKEAADATEGVKAVPAAEDAMLQVSKLQHCPHCCSG